MNLKTWGNYPIIKNKSFEFGELQALKTVISKHNELIPYGNGRSYGDSALSDNIINVKPYNYFFDTHFFIINKNMKMKYDKLAVKVKDNNKNSKVKEWPILFYDLKKENYQ